LGAGSDTIKVWDVVGGCRLVHSFSNHAKTITALALDAEGTRILSASLDSHVKVYDVEVRLVPIAACCDPDEDGMGKLCNVLKVTQTLPFVCLLLHVNPVPFLGIASFDEVLISFRVSGGRRTMSCTRCASKAPC
jgi:WD40 repeat protein